MRSSGGGLAPISDDLLVASGTGDLALVLSNKIVHLAERVPMNLAGWEPWGPWYWPFRTADVLAKADVDGNYELFASHRYFTGECVQFRVSAIHPRHERRRRNGAFSRGGGGGSPASSPRNGRRRALPRHRKESPLPKPLRQRWTQCLGRVCSPFTAPSVTALDQLNTRPARIYWGSLDAALAQQRGCGFSRAVDALDVAWNRHSLEPGTTMPDSAIAEAAAQKIAAYLDDG